MRIATMLSVLALGACTLVGTPEQRLDSRPEPPALIIDDAEGAHSLRSSNYCWDYREGEAIGTVCAESEGPRGNLPTFTLTNDASITLNFQFSWEQMSASITPEDATCDTYRIDSLEPRDFVFHELGPPGHYTVELDASGERGNARWAIRVDNKADLPYPETARC